MGPAAAAVAGLAYLDARLNLRQDINFLLSRRVAFAELMKASKKLSRCFVLSLANIGPPANTLLHSLTSISIGHRSHLYLLLL